MRHTILGTFFLMMLILLTVSCRATDTGGAPLQDRVPRISSLGFSFIPPPGTHWLEKYGESSMNYFKKTNPTNGTLFTSATELHTQQGYPTPEVFKEFIKNKRNPNEVPPRYTNAITSYTLESGIAPFCVRYHEQYEDRGAKNLYGRDFLIVLNHGLICLHPDNPKVGVDIYYSYRYPPNDKDEGFIHEGEEFVNSLKMLPRNPK